MSKRRQYRMYKIIIYMILFIAVIISICFFISGNNEKFGIFSRVYYNKNEIKDIIQKLPKKYESSIDISYKSGGIKGQLIRNEDDIIFRVTDPPILSGLQVEYIGDEISLKYKEIESKMKNNQIIMERFPVSKVIGIENMIYEGIGNKDKWHVKDDELYIEDKYKNKNFKLNIDLRKNKITSVNLDEDNMVVSYQN